MKRLRIAIVSRRRIFPPSVGGDHMVLATAKAFTMMGHKVSLLIHSDGARTRSVNRTYGITGAVTDCLKAQASRLSLSPLQPLMLNIVDQIRSFSKLEEYNDSGFDMVLSEHTDQLVLAARLAENHKSKIITRLHGVGVPSGLRQRSILERVSRKVVTAIVHEHEKYAASLSDLVVTLSHADEMLLRTLKVQNVRTLIPAYHVVPPEKPVEIERLVQKPGPYVSFISSLGSSSNYEAALRLMNLAAKVPDATFLVVGNHSGFARIRPHPSNVVITGWLSEDELKSVLIDSALLVIPASRVWGTPIKLVEALCWGKAVVTSPSYLRAFPKLKPGVHLVVEENVERYPQIIKGLLHDEERRQGLEREAKEYSKIFSLEEHVKRLDELISALYTN